MTDGHIRFWWVYYDCIWWVNYDCITGYTHNLIISQLLKSDLLFKSCGIGVDKAGQVYL